MLLFSNLAFSRIHKARLDENKALLSECLKLMSDEQQSIKLRAVCSQFFYNLIHKCTKSISMLNKKALLDELRLMIDEGESSIDKLTFDETIAAAPEEKSTQVHMLKTFVSNVRVISSMIGINCPTN